MTFISVDGYQVAADLAEDFRRDREWVAMELALLLRQRFAAVGRLTLGDEDGEGVAAYDGAGNVAFHFPLDPGNVARAVEALRAGELSALLADCL